MNKKRRLVSYVLSIFLIIFLFATVMSATLNCTVLSTQNVKKRIQESNYYAEVQKIIIDASQNYVMQSGFDESIMNNVINEFDIKKDVDGLVSYLYEGKEYVVQTDTIKSTLNNNINEFITANNYIVDDENQKNIDEFINKIADIYARNIEYSGETVKEISHTIKKVKKIVPAAMIICGILTIALAFAIKSISSPSIGIGMLSTGAILLYIKISAGVNVAINNILLMNKAFSNVLISMANDIVQKIFVMGIILCIAGIVWIIYAEATKKIKKMLLLDEHSQVIR